MLSEMDSTGLIYGGSNDSLQIFPQPHSFALLQIFLRLFSERMDHSVTRVLWLLVSVAVPHGHSAPID